MTLLIGYTYHDCAVLCHLWFPRDLLVNLNVEDMVQE